MIKPSCVNCEKRCLGCHSNCDDYKNFIQEKKNVKSYNNSFKPIFSDNKIYSKKFIKNFASV